MIRVPIQTIGTRTVETSQKTVIFTQDLSNYSIVLSAIGVAIAGYHYLLQIGVAPELPCSAVGFSATCSQRFVMQFGYITIPMMATTTFLLIAIMAVAGKIYKHREINSIES